MFPESFPKTIEMIVELIFKTTIERYIDPQHFETLSSPTSFDNVVLYCDRRQWLFIFLVRGPARLSGGGKKPNLASSSRHFLFISFNEEWLSNYQHTK